MTASDPALRGFVGRGDLARVETARRWNRGLIIGALTLTGLLVAGIVAMAVTGFGSWLTIALAAALGVGCLLVVRSAVLRGRMNRLMTAPGKPALVIDGDGITAGGLPTIPWQQVVFVGVLDDRARSGRIGAVPLFGWFGRMAGKAGSGLFLGQIGVRDGEGLRLHTHDAGAAGRIDLFGRQADGARRGVVPLLLDATLDDADTHVAIETLAAHAQARSIPFRATTSVLEATTFSLPLVEPDLPKLG